MRKKTLAIDLLKLDGDTQNRIEINGDTIDEYTELIVDEKWPFPPIDVFYDGTDYFVADGFHRLLAAIRAKRGSIPCHVHAGTAKDARIFGMTANDKNGLRMNREDKRACVEWLLDNGGRLSQKKIAEMAGASTWLVKEVVASRKEESLRHSSPTPSDGTARVETTLTLPSEGDDEEADTSDFVEKPERKTTKKDKPPKKYDRAAYYKQWDSSIGPLVRLVDNIARGLEESQNGHHTAVQKSLNDATNRIRTWLKIKD